MRLFKIILLILFCFSYVSIHAQVTVTTEQQLENLSDELEADIEDDLLLQQLNYFRRNPLNINTATADDLKMFKILSDLQIHHFIQYRKFLGRLINIYELQAVPTWDVNTIRKLLPFVTANASLNMKETFSERLKNGDHILLARYARVLEDQKGFDKSLRTHYIGNQDRLMFRYKYQYKNLLQYGVVADKDAGEQFFKGAQSKGFDFYSGHLFARQLGIVKSLALGDFTVNMGQGLMQWQSLAFRKSAEVTSIKRQAPVLLPYNSAGEFFFNRGAGITIAKGNVEATAFASFRKMSGNVGLDTLGNESVFTSFQTSGFHRTASEIADRYLIDQTSVGGNINFQASSFKVGVNVIHHQFSKDLEKRLLPYNRFAIGGDNWRNYSLDYSYTYKNAHFFGEAALDKNANKAFLNGIMVSVDPKVDISVLHRYIQSQYQAMYGNAFTESTYPTNEKGLYMGISIKPVSIWRIDVYADFFTFPWLRYRVDAPSKGKDFLVQLTYKPNKIFELYSRYRNERKEINESGVSTTTNILVEKPRQNWRTHLIYAISPKITLKSRTDIMWFDRSGKGEETGYLFYIEGTYKPNFNLSANLRLQYFETDGYNSRIHAYESDVLYSYNIPAFYDKGFRYYMNVNYDLSKKTSLWFRLAQTVYRNRETIGSGLDEINGKHRSEVKIQARMIL